MSMHVSFRVSRVRLGDLVVAEMLETGVAHSHRGDPPVFAPAKSPRLAQSPWISVPAGESASQLPPKSCRPSPSVWPGFVSSANR